MTVKELLERIDSKELSEWAAYHSLEPFGYLRSDLQAGIVASTMANCNRTKNSQKAFTPIDFMPIIANAQNKDKEPMDESDMIAVMRQFAEGNN